MTKQRKKALRLEIAALEIIRALESHVLGDGESMNASQVRAALALLKKRLPDLANRETGEKPTKKKARRHEDRLKDLI